jgi:hypothetical protein
MIFQSEMEKSIRLVEERLPDFAARAKELTNNAIQISLAFKDLKSEEQTALVQAYTDGLKKVWLCLIILAVVGTLSCLFAKEYSIEGKEQRDRQASWSSLKQSPRETPNETPNESRRPSQAVSRVESV